MLEAESVGWGASGRNGGIVSPAFACEGEAIAARVGPEAARALHRLSIEGRGAGARAIADLKIAGADPCPGLLNLRRFDRADDLHAHAEAFARDYGYDFTYLDRAAIRARLATRPLYHGLADAQAFHIHPLNYLRGLAAEIERLGGRIYEASPVVGVTLEGAAEGRAHAQG